jgi:hypothetical protein
VIRDGILDGAEAALDGVDPIDFAEKTAVVIDG